MAYIDDEDKLLKEQDPNQQQQADGQPGAVVSSGQPGAIGGDQSAIVGQSAGNGAVGAGGLGAWTNIQSYISANKNDTGSSKMLQDKVGKQFESDKAQMQSAADKTKSEAQQAASTVSEAQKNASTWLDQAGQAYRYPNKGDVIMEKVSNPDATAPQQSYSDIVGRFQGALEGEYNGPRSFDYGLSNDTQKYAQSLQDRDGFNQFMGNLYQERAGGPLSTGSRALQQQLDVNNESLVGTREKLLQDYAGLGSLRDQTVTDTTKALADAEQQYRVGQNSLRDFVGNTANELESTIGQKESEARANYETARGTGSGRAAATWGDDLSDPTRSGLANRYNEAGLLSGDLTWDQLQKEQDLFGNLIDTASFSAPLISANRDALNSWYSQQDAKYADTADAEERKWNALQDILRSSADRKKQGFSVRG